MVLERKTRLALSSLLGAIALALLLVVFVPFGYEEWLIYRTQSRDDEVWRSAIRDLLDRNCLRATPHIVEAFVRKGTREDLAVWQARIFRRFGSEERRALPAYRRLLQDEDETVRRRALQVLFHCGFRLRGEVPILARVLQDPSAELRWKAALSLAALSPGTQQALPELLEALRDADEDVCCAAIIGLGSLAPVTSAPVAELAVMVQDPSDRVAAYAAGTLGAFGPRAEPAVPALIAALARMPVRASAARTLGLIGPRARGAVCMLKQVLKESVRKGEAWPDSCPEVFWCDRLSREPAVDSSIDDEQAEFPEYWSPEADGRFDALSALRELGWDGSGMEDELLELCRTKNSSVSGLALEFVARNLGHWSLERRQAALEQLLMALERYPASTDWLLTNYAAAELLGGLGDAVLPVIRDALRSDSPRRAVGAAYAAGLVGEPARSLYGELHRALSSGFVPLQLAALVAIQRLEPHTAVVPDLMRLCRQDLFFPDSLAWSCDSNGNGRMELPRSIVWLIEGLGSEAENSVPLLIRTLKEKPQGMALPQVVAWRILLKLGRAAEAFPQLVRGFGVSRCFDLEVLCSAGAFPDQEKEVASVFLGKLRSPDDDTNVVLREVARLGPRAAWAASAVQDLLEQFQTRVRAFDLETTSLVELGDEFQWLRPELLLEAAASLRGVRPELSTQLFKVLEETRSRVLVLKTIDALGKYPTGRHEQLAAVEHLLKDPDLLFRAQAARTYWKMGGGVEKSAAVLREVLQDPWSWRDYEWETQPVLLDTFCAPDRTNLVHELARRTLEEMGVNS